MALTAVQLQAIIDAHEQEGLYLEFKRGASLALSSDARRELVKDCTGFANASGGMILYGVAEDDVDGVLVAAALSPVTDQRVSGDWFTSVIRSNTSPPLSQFEITELPVSGGRVIVVQIEASSTAHQNLMDHRYYQRSGRTTEPMMDFQIRDVMNRRLRPSICVEHKMSKLEITGDRHRYGLDVSLENVGQVTLENWRFEIDIPCEVIRDTRRDPELGSEIEGLLGGWPDTCSLEEGPDKRSMFRVACGDPDEAFERRLILHPGQKRKLLQPGKVPDVTVEIDHATWRKVHGRSILWRVFMPNTQPIVGEWAFDDWCIF